MNILLTGAAGQLGSELIPLLSGYGQLVATDRGPQPDNNEQRLENWAELDVRDGGGLEALLNRLRPKLIVNSAAFTAVDLAETEPEATFDVNANLPGRLARWAKQNDAALIHYSTDYVFNGNSSLPYVETDCPDPQSVYGKSKLAGESAIKASQCMHCILRTSWVYSSHGKNFVLSMLELARKGVALKVVDDQRGCPTWARNLASASLTVIESWQASVKRNHKGIFHYCDNQVLSWYDFARTIFAFAVDAGVLYKEPDLTPVTSAEFPQLAARPGSSVLDTGRIGEVFGICPQSFNQSLQTVINEYRANENTDKD